MLAIHFYVSHEQYHCVKSVRIWSYSGPNAGNNGPD